MTWEQPIRKDRFNIDYNVPPQPPRGSNSQSTVQRPPHRDTAQLESCPLASHGTPMRMGHARPAADNHRDPGFDSDIVIQFVNERSWWRGLPLAPADSVVSLFATLSGQSLASVRDLYKREATCEYSFGLVFFPSGMATHSYATRLAGLTGRFGLSSPAADQRPAAALREAPPNSDDS